MEALFHCTATGKAVAAFLPEEKIEELIKIKGLTSYTPKTIVSPGMLKAHFASIRENGYAVDDEEFDIGVRCIAAPVRNFKGKVIGSVGISGSIVTMTLENIQKHIPVVLEISKKISSAMGYKEG
jgi:DNA-binding IclR family transcriptional regulator